METDRGKKTELFPLFLLMFRQHLGKTQAERQPRRRRGNNTGNSKFASVSIRMTKEIANMSDSLLVITLFSASDRWEHQTEFKSSL